MSEIKIETKPVIVNIVGDSAVGKTAYVHRHLTGEFENKYIGGIP